MIPNGFVLAMHVHLALAFHDLSHLKPRRSACWAIVGRWGPEGRFLSVSWAASAASRRQGAAPADLTPRLTCFGVLAADPGHGALFRFAMRQCLPEGITVAGRFLPCEGSIHLAGAEGGRLRLSAAGTTALGHRVAAWTLSAGPVPWIGDLAGA